MSDDNSRKRTVADKLICGCNFLRYWLSEAVMLNVARMKNERFYDNNIEENPLISVYIPTYNRAELLAERSIPTVLAQTYKNFELIVLGDHCTDKTEETVLKIKDQRIRFYNLPTRGYRYPPTVENHWLAGPVVAANAALRLVQGKWIARLDDDDIWTPVHLETLIRFAQRGQYEFVSAAYVRESNGGRMIMGGETADGSYYNKNKKAKGRGPRIGGTCTWLYRSYLKFFKYNINCWRKSWNQVNDVDISQRLFHAGVRMGYVDQVLAWYLPRPGEKGVGLEAYKMSAKEKIKHYEFEL